MDQAPHPDAVYLDSADVARRWKCAVQTVVNLRHRGTGPPYLKTQRMVRYPLADLVAWEHAHMRRGDHDQAGAA